MSSSKPSVDKAVPATTPTEAPAPFSPTDAETIAMEKAYASIGKKARVTKLPDGTISVDF